MHSILIVTKLITLLFSFFIATSFIYHSVPIIKQDRFFSIGSFISSSLCMIISVFFSFYLNNFSNYNRFYGSIGVMIALMTWFFLLSLVWLIGFEINLIINQKNITKE